MDQNAEGGPRFDVALATLHHRRKDIEKAIEHSNDSIATLESTIRGEEQKLAKFRQAHDAIHRAIEVLDPDVKKPVVKKRPGT